MGAFIPSAENQEKPLGERWQTEVCTASQTFFCWLSNCRLGIRLQQPDLTETAGQSVRFHVELLSQKYRKGWGGRQQAEAVFKCQCHVT